MNWNWNAIGRTIALYAVILIILGVDAHVLRHWSGVHPMLQVGFFLFNGAVLVIAIIVVRNLTWPVNVLAIVGAFVTFYMIMPF